VAWGVSDPDSFSARSADLLVSLARALGAAGTPAHRVEEALTLCARRLGIDGEFFATPTSVFASLDRAGGTRTHLLRIESGDTNLERLTDLGEVLDGLLDGGLTPEAALVRVREISGRRARYSRATTLVSFVAVSACAARFFGGGWHDIVAAAVAGFVVGVIMVFGGARIARLAEFFAGVGAAAVAVVVAARWGPAAPQTIMLAGLIVLIPGLTLTLAVTELSTRNLVAGTARLVGALTTFVSIGFGVALGQRIGGLVPVVETAVRSEPLPAWTLPVSLAVVSVPLTVLFRARPRQMPAVMCAAFIAFYGARLGTWGLGPELGACVASFLVGVASNGFARVTGQPAAVPLLPGILLLVPGSVGFASVRLFVERNTVAGVATAFDMLFVAVSLVAGLLFASAVVQARRPL